MMQRRISASLRRTFCKAGSGDKEHDAADEDSAEAVVEDDNRDLKAHSKAKTPVASISRAMKRTVRARLSRRTYVPLEMLRQPS
jgi:hypothetical protein